MNSSEVPTVKAKRNPVILVVGFPPAFVRRCHAAAVDTHATVVGVESGGESAFATHTIPIAVVMRDDAVATSPLGAIAGELGIELVSVASDAISDARLTQAIHDALRAAQSRVKPVAR